MRFKTDVVEDRFNDLHPKAQEIAKDIAAYALKNHGIDMMITDTVSTYEEDKELLRLSDTHRTRRAWDFRTMGIPDEDLDDILAYATKKWSKYGAIVHALPRLIVDKRSQDKPHLHCQLNRKFALPVLTYKGNNNGKEKKD